MSLTSACVVHSNVYGLANFHCIRYLTVVDPILSSSPTMHKHHHITSGSVEIPLTANSGSIRVGPVPQSIGTVATKIQVSFAEQCQGLPHTNVLQVHKTIVLVYFVSEQEAQISSTWEG